MIESLKKFKEDYLEASKLGKDVKVDLKKFKRIVFCGIGGSGLVGDVVESLDIGNVFSVHEEIKFEKSDLVFVVSYSGNTDETIKLYNKAKLKKCRIIIVSSGGKLGRKDEEMVLIPRGYLPRESFIWMILPVLNILKVKYGNGGFGVGDRKIAENIARSLKGKIPIIYSDSEKLKFLAYRWQTYFNENCKILSHSNYFSEINHNEIEARLNEKFKVILLNSGRKFNRKGLKFLDFKEVKLKGKKDVDKIIYGLYLGYMVSWFLAKFLKVNSVEIKRIEGLKK